MTTFPIRQRILNAAYSLPIRPSKAVDHLPGPSANWLTGHGARLAKDDARYIAEMTDLYGSVLKIPLPFGGRAVVMTGAAANRRVLGRPEKVLSNHNGYAQANLFGDSIVTRDFEDHAELRKIIAPPFAKPALRGHLEVIQRLISAHFDPVFESREQTFDMFPLAKKLALGIAAEIFAGMNLGRDQERMSSALAAMLGLVSARVPIRIPGGAYARGVRGRKFATAYFESEIPARRAGSGDDFFSLLCRAENEAGERLGDGEIIDNVIGAMIAGHDTTTVALSAMAYELAREPEWQQRVRKDCEQAISESPGETVSIEAAAGLESLEWCAKEVLRLYSPIRYVQRRAVCEFEFEGHRIPKNSTVLLSMHHTHHNAKYFESPEVFRPERFAGGESGKSFDSDAWAPFGKGPHVCLGMGFALLEIKAVFCSLLTNVRLDLPREYRLKVEGLPVSMPTNGVPIRLTRIG